MTKEFDGLMPPLQALAEAAADRVSCAQVREILIPETGDVRCTLSPASWEAIRVSDRLRPWADALRAPLGTAFQTLEMADFSETPARMALPPDVRPGGAAAAAIQTFLNRAIANAELWAPPEQDMAIMEIRFGLSVAVAAWPKHFSQSGMARLQRDAERLRDPVRRWMFGVGSARLVLAVWRPTAHAIAAALRATRTGTGTAVTPDDDEPSATPLFERA